MIAEFGACGASAHPRHRTRRSWEAAAMGELPDPMKGIRGVFAAVLVLESIVVLLALLVFARFGNGPPAVGVAVIVGLAVLMIVGSGLQRRPWGLGYALVVQL